MRKILDVPVGKEFGRLTVQGPGERHPRWKYATWRCQCSCGAPPKDIYAGSVRCGMTNSCGCIRKQRHTKHGMNKTHTHKVWQRMRNRYSVVPEWHEFKNFLAVVGTLEKGRTIDVVDVLLPYGPTNFRVVTTYEKRFRRKIEAARSVRTNVFVPVVAEVQPACIL